MQPGAMWARDMIGYRNDGGTVPDYKTYSNETYGDIDPEIIQRILKSLFALDGRGMGDYRSALATRRENAATKTPTPVPSPTPNVIQTGTDTVKTDRQKKLKEEMDKYGI